MKARGFTIIELVIVMAIVAFTATVTLTVYKTVQQQNDLANAKIITVGALRQAQEYARASKYDSVWGVKITAISVTIFRGTSYASRSLADDIVESIPAGITVSGDTEIVFSKLYGVPTSPTNTTIASAYASKTISVNAAGSIAY